MAHDWFRAGIPLEAAARLVPRQDVAGYGARPNTIWTQAPLRAAVPAAGTCESTIPFATLAERADVTAVVSPSRESAATATYTFFPNSGGNAMVAPDASPVSLAHSAVVG